MNNRAKVCTTCRIVDTVCFWGDKPQKQWKRPTLFIISIMALLCGIVLLNINIGKSSMGPFTILLSSFLGFILVTGIVVSVIGCDRCVAKLIGDI